VTAETSDLTPKRLRLPTNERKSVEVELMASTPFCQGATAPSDEIFRRFL
jgi:hypothetical protein